MMTPGRTLVDEFGEAMAAGDVERLASMYAEGGTVLSYLTTATGRDEIRAAYVRTLGQHGHYRVRTVDQFRDAGSLVMWDSTVDTEPGVLQTSHIVTRNDDGLIEHHVPLIRGYWGM